MDYIIYFAVTIGILVFIHEFGHFAAAKLSGMRVDVFAIGFGKRMLGWNKKTGFSFGELPKDFDNEGETDYRLSMLPLGGYVKIAGMVDESFDTSFAKSEPKPYEFRSKNFLQKTFVITAGVLMNLFLAWLIFFGVNFFQDTALISTTTIGPVIPNSQADSLGFKSGDEILEINGTVLNSWDEMQNSLYVDNLGEQLDIKIEREGEITNLLVSNLKLPQTAEDMIFYGPDGMERTNINRVSENSPASNAGLKAGDVFLEINSIPIYYSSQVAQIISKSDGTPVDITILRNSDSLFYSITPGTEGTIGVEIGQKYTGEIIYESKGFFESMGLGVSDIINYTALTFAVAGKVISGKVEFGQAFGGPVRIAEMAARSADSGLISFILFLAILSLSLAIINIMPFPVLDGGHLAMIIIETITKREIPVRIKIAIQNTGMVILLLLMVFIIYNDILSL
jgi:regulator of sigma E protease